MRLNTFHFQHIGVERMSSRSQRNLCPHHKIVMKCDSPKGSGCSDKAESKAHSAESSQRQSFCLVEFLYEEAWLAEGRALTFQTTVTLESLSTDSKPYN